MGGIMPINLGGYLLPVKLSSHPRGAPAEDPSLAATGRGMTKNVCDVLALRWLCISNMYTPQGDGIHPAVASNYVPRKHIIM